MIVTFDNDKIYDYEIWSEQTLYTLHSSDDITLPPSSTLCCQFWTGEEESHLQL